MDRVIFHSSPSLNNWGTWPLYLVSCHREPGVFLSRISSSSQGFLPWLLRKTKAQGKAGCQCHRQQAEEPAVKFPLWQEGKKSVDSVFHLHRWITLSQISFPIILFYLDFSVNLRDGLQAMEIWIPLGCFARSCPKCCVCVQCPKPVFPLLQRQTQQEEFGISSTRTNHTLQIHLFFSCSSDWIFLWYSSTIPRRNTLSVQKISYL